MTATAVGQRTGRLAEKVRRKSRSAAGKIRLELLGGFHLTRGTEVLVLSPGEQRLLAFLAVPNKPMQRTFVAGNLWLESSEQRAAGNLRSTLWRLRALDRTLVASTRSQLALGPAVSVDLHETSAHARDVLVHMHARPLSDAPMMVAGDLLPDWYDDLGRHRARAVSGSCGCTRSRRCARRSPPSGCSGSRLRLDWRALPPTRCARARTGS